MELEWRRVGDRQGRERRRRIRQEEEWARWNPDERVKIFWSAKEERGLRWLRSDWELWEEDGGVVTRLE